MQMEETFHINFEGHKTETHYVNIVKTRLWSYILMSINWLIRNPIHGTTNVQNGIGLMIINNLAISIEGFITDLITEHLFENELEKLEHIKKLGLTGWKKKKEHYNKIFDKKIESYASYKSIETLFFLRNNISHGKTHLEIDRREIVTGNKSKIESADNNYQKVRSYLIENKVIQETEVSSNVKVLWTLNIARHFWIETQIFLAAIAKENESSKKQGILAEFETVLSNKY
jgi:hypothetical protein